MNHSYHVLRLHQEVTYNYYNCLSLQYEIDNHKELTKNLIQIVMNTINVQNHECSDEYAQKVGRSLSGADEDDLPVPKPQPLARRGTLAAIFGTGVSESGATASPAENEPVNGVRRKGS